MWSLSTAANASSYTYPATASWYTGPIESNPLAARLKKAGITSPFFSYGTMGSASKGDQSEPVDQITYTLTQN